MDQAFISSLSHETRTPLNGIVGYTQLLQNTSLNSVQKQYVSAIQGCSVQLLSIVNDILDFSKLSTGKGQITTECFSVKDVTEEVDTIIQQKIKEKKQKLHFVVNKNVPEFLVGDKHKILQILINLISNANKFSGPGKRIIVTFSFTNPKLVCSVEDNGPGIDPKKWDKIFTPFTKFSPGVEGSGLGLAISKKLVELLNGEISFESDIEGTTFTFSITVDTDFQKTISENCKGLENKLILVIDPDVENRIAISDALFSYKIKTMACGSGREAYRLLKQYTFSAIIIDTCLESWRTIVEKLDREIPIILSAPSNFINPDPTIENVVTLPINPIKLADILGRVVSKVDVTQFLLNPVPPSAIDPNSTVKILIAEDVKYNCIMLTKMLNTIGYKDVDTCSDGEECVQKIRETKYDILLLDLKMPKKDGFEVAKEVMDKVKIAVISASVLDEDRENCKKLGIKYFLQKPFNMGHLKNMMFRLINGTIKQ
jgi:CheY-like chemotaxis protein